MPLVKATLDNELSKLMDTEFVNHEGFPTSIVDASQRWGDVVDAYASVIVPPTLSSAIAKTAFQGVMATITIDGIIKFPLAFTAYGVALASGMLPNFTGVPPPSPINFAPSFAIGYAGGSQEDVASSMCAIIDAWFKTGTAINTSTSAVIPWS